MTRIQRRFFFCIIRFLTIGAACFDGRGLAQVVSQVTPTVHLHVAVFAYLPDASAAIERLEHGAEKYARAQGHDIDVDVELWDPYADAADQNGLERTGEFDLVEIDCCRLKELIDGGFGGLDPLPPTTLQDPAKYVDPAKTMLTRTATYAKYVQPHWVCGNFLVYWSTNARLAGAESFADFMDAVDPSNARPVLADLYGTTGLGEFYADALIDQQGTDQARNQLLALANTTDDTIVLDPTAEKSIVELVKKMLPVHQQNLDQYHNHNYIYPREFAACKYAALIGYSERAYYIERELELLPQAALPCIKPADLVVRQFSFGKKSQGTPTWVDGFVIPKGKASSKSAEIEILLAYLRSLDGYRNFIEPTSGEPESYLLPAVATAYDPALLAKEPALTAFRNQLDGSFPIDDPQLWKGMKKAGKKLKSEVGH